VDMEWDKIWSDNMRTLDKVATRYMAVDAESPARVQITNFAEHYKSLAESDIVSVSIPLIPKEPEKGTKAVLVSPSLLVEKVDIQDLKPGDCLGLMRFCVTKVESVDVEKSIVNVSIIPDGDFRTSKCRLVTWVANSPYEPKVLLWEHDYILKEGNDDEEVDDGGDSWRKTINPVSKASSVVVANGGVRLLQKGDFVQFERRGLFIVDKPYAKEDNMVEFIKIPDGKTKAMSSIQSKLEHR